MFNRRGTNDKGSCRLCMAVIIGLIWVLLAGCTEGIMDSSGEGETRLLTQKGVQARISGSRVVWEEIEVGGDGIVLFDLATGERRRLSVRGRSSGWPDIGGERVVWIDKVDRDVVLFDLSTGTRRILSASEGAGAGFPTVSDERVAFVRFDESSRGEELVVVELRSGEAKVVAENLIVRPRIAMDGHILVWSSSPADDRTVPPAVFMHELETGITRRISPDAGEHFRPDISGGRIVWEAELDQDARDVVFMLEVETGERRVISREGSANDDVAISGNLVVLVENKMGDGETDVDIALFDLVSGDFRRLTDDEDVNQARPDVSDGRVIWEDERDGRRALLVRQIRR